MIEELLAAAQNETLVRFCGLISGILIGAVARPRFDDWHKNRYQKKSPNKTGRPPWGSTDEKGEEP
ncbi:MAG: hypothetical protein GWN87_25025 [Desulfuromonadales bacterium]|nr:hypothetical protein [Desulfuromonadales bacterium]